MTDVKPLAALALILDGLLMLAVTYLAVTIAYDDYTDGGGFWWAAFASGWAGIAILALLGSVASRLFAVLADVKRPKSDWH